MTSESKNDTFLETSEVEFEKVCLDQINRMISTRTHACLQLESYNQLFQEIPEIFHMYSLSTISAPDPHKVTAGNAVEDTRPFSLRFGNVYYDPPTKTTQNQRTGKLYPFEARIRGMTYAVRVSVDITLHDHNTGETVTHVRMPFFDIPCMIRSEWCHLHNATKQQIIEAKECLAEPGGYFIIDGAEKCVINQMRMAYNNMMPVKSSKRGGIVVDYRTYSEETGKTSQVQAFIDGGNVRFDLTFITSPISLTVLLLALDVDDVIQILSEAGLMDSPYNLYTSSAIADFIQMSAESEQYTPQEAACLWIGSNARQQQPSDEAAIEYTRSKILRTSMFIHLGASAPHTERVNIILRLVRTVIRANLPKSHELYIPPTDKDNLVNKRVETTGVLLREIIRMHMSSLVKSVIPKDFAKSSFNSGTVVDYLRKQGEKITVDINKRFKETTPWDNPARGGTNNFSRTGVSQALSRMNMPAMCSQLLRINQPISKSAKVKEPRHVNSTHIGFIDPFDTPESGSAGLVLQLCSMIKISHNHPTVIIADVISDILHNYPTGDAPVMVNGIVLPGGVADPVAVVKDLRNRRVQGDIPFDVSVSYDLVENSVAIHSEDGRMMRMLWYVGDQNINEFMAEILESISQGGNLQTLQDAGLVRWIDSVEITDLTVAMEPCDFSKGTFEYMEIHPSVIVGMCTQNAPYSEHMPSPRCCYLCSHYKQGLGVATTVDTFRTDTTSHRMWYPSTPLVSTRQSTLITLPTGQVCTVAICTMNGAGQEDAIVMNRASVDRGLFRVTTRKTHTIQEDPMQHISFPTEHLRESMERTRGYDYSKLGPDGIVRVGEYVGENDVIVARYTSNTERKASGAIEETRRDSSLVVARDKEGFVDTVHVARNGDGYLVVHVIIRKSRIPEPGDKWACYTPDHEILTERGWVNITEVTMEDRVASLMDDHTVEYCQPIEVGGYDYTGDIYALETNHISLRVTPNHRMYTSCRETSSKYSICRADELYGRRRRFLKNCEGVIRQPEEYPDCFILSPEGEITHFILPAVTDAYYYNTDNCEPRPVPINEFLLFLGIWMAEGFMSPPQASRSRGDGTQFTPQRTRVMICVHKQRVKDAINSVISPLGLNKTVQSASCPHNGEPSVWSFSRDRGLAAVFEPLCVGAVNKFLPDWVWYLSMEQCRILIDGMILGDGHYMRGTSTRRFGTSSRRLADDFQRLCLHAGWSANVGLHASTGAVSQNSVTGREVRTNVDSWQLSVITTQNRPKINKYSAQPGKQQDFWEPYSGKVYCCRVPGPGVVYVRRNGKGIWCGNTRTAQKGTVAYLEAPENLPFDPLTGQTPDIIFNPHGLPSRMTLGYIYELIQGRISVITGDTADATIFSESSRPKNGETIGHVLERDLKSLGLNSTGTREMYDGRTGQPIQAQILMGPTFYQRLKHLVSDKVHARAKGDVHMVFGQPVGGRERGGGLRAGKPFCPSGCANIPLVYGVVGDMTKLRERLVCAAAA